MVILLNRDKSADRRHPKDRNSAMRADQSDAVSEETKQASDEALRKGIRDMNLGARLTTLRS
jgi:hypothetical protein